jgi:signal transduction histidine kinase
MLQQIVSNLLSNAIRFTHQGHITIRSRALLRGVCVEVEDSGIGIAPEDMPRVFDDYFQANPAGESSVGFGLGLSMARQMASLLGGTLSVESQVGCGSTFTLLLPPSALAVPSNSRQPCQPAQHQTPADGTHSTVRRQVVVQTSRSE